MPRPPRAPYGDVLEYAEQALAAKSGLVVDCKLPRYATNFRMQFYKRRTELRDQGDNKYDQLICTVRYKYVTLKRRNTEIVAAPI